MKEMRILSPSGSLGYGVNADSLERALAEGLSAIGADAGSTDCGPHYLGAGEFYHSRAATKRDIRLLLRGARALDIPLLIGSAGVAGSRVHVKWTVDILREVAKEENLHFRLAVIHSDQDKEFLKQRVRLGKVHPMPGVPELTEDRVDACPRVVAQMGTEPYIEALDNRADVIVAGRSCDTAIFAAPAVRGGFDRGLSLHMGKIIECAAMCAMPPTGRDCIVGVIRDDHFVIEAPNPARRVTPGSVAGHMIYEVEHPFLQEEPSGRLDFSRVRMESYNERATMVAGTVFTPHSRPTLRFEGAEQVGYRSVVFGGIRDPFLIRQIDAYVAGCTEQVREILGNGVDYKLDWKLYGRDAILGSMEPLRNDLPHELGILAQILAPTQGDAHDVAAFLEARMIGFPYEGARTRTAHVAFPFSPIVIDTGPVYRFSVLHIAELADERDLLRLFPIEYAEI